ncbi:MAG: hypothetical protein HC847_27800 [Hydrococcus sp. RU_2_2]|jgi:Ycf66 protein N-terminus|nr:hypothetical protein [Hydrococcus sp. RU_2_2]NJP22195.1 hypothetical protein [Hydrococcus sp. CRU_1_1]NJQ98481.1 hypothetical protein [Hydrococcus sp. CSU_1_8]
MVNFGLNSASILGIFLAVAGAGLYFLRSIRPELSRDHDIFFAAVGLLCGLILLFQGWRLDPILQFGQLLLTGTAIFFAVETVRLRGATAEQAKRNSPIVERDRQVSRKPVYTDAALDLQLEPYEEEDYSENNPRLKGTEDARGSRNSRYESEEPRSPRNRRSSERYDDYKETPRKRRPRPTAESASRRYDVWEDSQENWEERPQTSRSRRPRPESDIAQTSSSQTKKRRPRPSDIGGTPYNDDTDSIPTDYVDYQPIDESPKDNADWEQESRPKGDYPSGSGRADRNSRNTSEGDYPSGSSKGDRDNPIQFDY